MAAAISSGVELSDDWKAWAVPWKRAVERDRRLELAPAPAGCAATASPSAVPGARLNEIVTAGNWPWWLMVSGAILLLNLRHGAERHLRAVHAGDIDARQRRRVGLELRQHLEHDLVLRARAHRSSPPGAGRRRRTASGRSARATGQAARRCRGRSSMASVRRGDLLVRRHVLQPGQLAHGLLDDRRPVVQLRRCRSR